MDSKAPRRGVPRKIILPKEKTVKKLFMSLGEYFIFISDFLLSIILIPQLLFLTIAYMMEEYYQGFPLTKLIYLIYLFIMALFIFSLSRTVMKFSKKPMEKYRALSCPRSLKTDLLFLIKEKRIFINLGLVLVIYPLLPLDWPFMALKLAFPDRTALATAIYILLLSVLHLFGYLSGIKAWRNKTKDPSKKKYTASCVLLTVAYLLCPTAIIAVLPLIYTLFFLVPELMRIEIILPIVLLISFIVSYRYLRAYLKRRSLLKELKKICSERQYTLSQIRDPYRSLFFDFEGESFSVTVNSKTYSCKLLSGAKKYTPLVIHPNAQLEFVHNIRFLKFIIYSYSTLINIDYRSDHRKILIVNPTPKFVFTPRKGKASPIDNAEVIGEFKFYTATAFLRALEMDILEK